MAQLLFVHAHSPLHPGTGQSLGAVDLAVARDKATGYPYLPGSSLKGALRAKARAHADVVKVFGPDTSEAEKSSGSGVFGDANLLFLPMKTAKGLFGYVTTEYILRRFLRDAELAGVAPRPAKGDVGQAVTDGNSVQFDEVSSATVTQPPLLTKALGYLPQKLLSEVQPRAVCVTDDMFRMLLEQGLDLVTRVRINPETNTADAGGLWLEENLPVETILVSVIGALRDSRTVATLIGKLAEGTTYLGGHVTVGRGRTQLHIGGAP